MSREDKIQFVGLIILAGFAAAAAFHFFLGNYLGMSYPYNTFLFIPQDAFMDFLSQCRLCRNLNPYFEPNAVVPFGYFPLAGVMFYGFSQLPPALAQGIFAAAFLAPLCLISAWQLRGGNKYDQIKNLIIFALLTYPTLFIIDRGNCEGLLFVCLAISVLMSDSRPNLKSFLLAVPIAMKLYPAVFLVLLIGDRKYKEAALTIIWAAVLSLASLLCFKGGFVANLSYIANGFGLYEKWPLFGWNHFVCNYVGLFAAMKMCLVAINDYLCPITFWSDFKAFYRFGSLLAFGLLTLYILFVEKERWKKTALLVFSMLLFPEISAAYKLIHVLLPLFLFVNAAKAGKKDMFYAVMLGLLLIPKHYFYFPLDSFQSDTRYCDVCITVFLDPLIMVATSAVIIVEGFRNRRLAKQVYGDRTS